VNYGLATVTAPAEEPITLTEAKAHLRVYIDDDDTLITAQIAAARQWFEETTYRQLVTATYDLVLDDFPSGACSILVPRAPLQSVTSINYTDSAGDEQTMDSGDYVVSTSREPGEIRLGYSKTWPATRNEPDAVTVRFVAGYGDESTVPEAIKAAIKLVVGHLYEHREEVIVGETANLLPMGAKSIADMYRLGDELLAYGVA